MTTLDKALWFMLGSMANAIAWRVDAGSYATIGYPASIFIIVVMLIIYRRP
jgi:hypothetical protein